MSIKAKIITKLRYPWLWSYYFVKSHISRIKSLTHKDKLYFEKPYEGQDIVLLALYQKGLLRDDIINLLRTIKSSDSYIICINTQAIQEAKQYQGLIDCYIERYNFGRDFGSYKTGFKHVYQRNWHQNCPRLLMLNDSLFYSKQNISRFIKNLLTTEKEILGATETYEHNHHLGSFCISISGTIIRSQKFRSYWARYSNSDSRPAVIRHGEAELSKVLRSCAISQDSVSALFNLTWFSDQITNNPALLDNAVDLSRTSKFSNWKQVSLHDIAQTIITKYVIVNASNQNEQHANTKYPGYFIDSTSQLMALIAAAKLDSEATAIKRRIHQQIRSDWLQAFSQGSQIHQNAIVLHHLGLPIIKLDGLYRGMFSVEDVEKLALQLETQEAQQFKHLMYSRPTGSTVLYGWKKSAFDHGFI